MITNQCFGEGAYAPKLFAYLENNELLSGHVTKKEREAIINNLAKWSVVNEDVYGYPQLHEKQLMDLLGSTLKNVVQAKIIDDMVEKELIALTVEQSGTIGYQLSPDLCN